MNDPLIVISGYLPSGKSAASSEEAVIEQCHEMGIDSWWIPHLYHISESSRLWKKLAEHQGKVILYGRLPPRPTEWILRRHGIDIEGWTFVNLNDFQNVEEAVRIVLDCGIKKTSPGKTWRSKETVTERWYPVMDESRCAQCGHCLQFCLFGVYELNTEGQVKVCNPDQCKPGCPACARICPHSAIMFPLYENDEAIAGAPGRFVTLDVASRKMFYARSKQPCPRCGATGQRKSKATGPLCPECGWPCDERGGPVFGDTKIGTVPPSFDDLDSLIDRLDQRMRRRG